MSNPKQQFVVNTISRADIATTINYGTGYQHDEPGFLQPDDARLTNKICEQYAKDLHQVEMDTYGKSQETITNAIMQIAKYYAIELGLD